MMLSSSREYSDGSTKIEVSYTLAPLEAAMRRVVKSGHGTRIVKAELLSLCRRARRNGTSIETLVLDLHRMLDRQRSLWWGADGWDRDLRQKVMCYVISTYHREGR
jgi:hypothetical protein